MSDHAGPPMEALQAAQDRPQRPVRPSIEEKENTRFAYNFEPHHASDMPPPAITPGLTDRIGA